VDFLRQAFCYVTDVNTTYFIQTDHLGSTRLLTGVDQTVRESDDYYPYGEPITAGTQSLLKFSGKERDSETGLDNFGARYNAATLGRFMTPDPLISSAKVWSRSQSTLPK
jgi:RHS repeat-associated protein